MKFVLLLAAFALEHLAPHLDGLRRYGWWRAFERGAARHLGGWRAWDGPAGVLMLLSPPLLVAFALLHLLSGFAAFVAGLALVLYSLGPRDLSAEVERYLVALSVDSSAAFESPGPEQSLPREAGPAAVARALLVQVNDRLCAPLFWFVCLGPVAAFAVRLASLLARSPLERGAGLQRAAIALDRLLGFVPARLVAFGYGAAGSLQPSLVRARLTERLRLEDNEAVLADAGLGALQIDDPEDYCARDRGNGIVLVREVRSLVGRTLFGWLAFYAALVIAGLDG